MPNRPALSYLGLSDVGCLNTSLVAVINEQDKISLWPNEVMWIEKKLFQVQK